MSHVSDTDRHPYGERIEVKHACPNCPSPLIGGVARFPNPFCPHCYGTGLVDEAELDRWTRKMAAAAAGGQ